jgi:hypothetical protein
VPKIKERRNVDLSGIGVIEMPVQLTLGIMSTRHNINDAQLLTPLGVGTIINRVTKVTIGIESTWTPKITIMEVTFIEINIVASINFNSVLMWHLYHLWSKNITSMNLLHESR